MLLRLLGIGLLLAAVGYLWVAPFEGAGTPAPGADRKAAYERGYSDSQDASCDVWRDLDRGRISPEGTERALLERKTRGADQYDAGALRVRYRTGWDTGAYHISMVVDDVCRP